MSSQRVLVVGASGNMGTKIVHELIALGASVRVTHRASSKPESVAALKATGAELVVADLADAASLVPACAGIDVIVSSVQGLRETIVDGQTHLLRAAEKNGVARMIPSDYSLDFFQTPEGGNRNLDLRREFDRVLDASSVRGTSVLCGAFMELLLRGAMAPDGKTGVFKVWGDPEQPYDFTHTDDVAKYTAAVAMHADSPRVVRVAGDSLSPRGVGAAFADIRKLDVKMESAGTLAEMEALITRMRSADEAPHNPFPVWQQLQYVRDMASGRGKLDPIDNASYPGVTPMKVRALLSAPR